MSPVQFCYDDREKILVVGYDDGTVVTFKDDVKILSQKYMTLTTDQFVHLLFSPLQVHRLRHPGPAAAPGLGRVC